jgi:hypothetical protein
MMTTRSTWPIAAAIVMGFGILGVAHWHALREPIARMGANDASVKRRYEILLPIKDNAGRELPRKRFDETREDIVARFGGVTIFPQPAQGVWVDSGKRYEEESIRLVVDVTDDTANRRFFENFKHVLNERFRQEDVYVTSTMVNVVGRR